jgi:predicted DNA binding protein
VIGPFETEVEAERGDCSVSRVLSSRIKATYVYRVIPLGEFTDHVIGSEVEDEMRSELRKLGIKVVKVDQGKVWVRARSCSACRLLHNSEALIVEGKMLGERIVRYRLILPSVGALGRLIKEMNKAGLKPRVLEKRRPKETSELTPRQFEVLILAYRRGLFDVDRRTSLKELSELLGVSPPSLEELMRRALKKVVGKYLREHLKVQE